MKKIVMRLATVLLACALAISIIEVTSFSANSLRESSIVQRSKIMGSLLSENSSGILLVVTDKEMRKMLGSFIGAVADAYVTFELVPLNEGETFNAVFQSVNSDMFIDKFEYIRKDLKIYGTATLSGLTSFVKELEASTHFSEIFVESFEQEDDSNEISFVLLCKSEVLAPPHLINPPLSYN